jgi:hypothetical protein
MDGIAGAYFFIFKMFFTFVGLMVLGSVFSSIISPLMNAIEDTKTKKN